MASKNGGLSKDDKEFLRQENQKLFENGKGVTLTKADMENPSLRVALNQAGAQRLNTNQYNQLIEMGQKKNFSRFEQLAVSFGIPSEEASRLSSVAKLESHLGKHQKEANVKRNDNNNKIKQGESQKEIRGNLGEQDILYGQ